MEMADASALSHMTGNALTSPSGLQVLVGCKLFQWESLKGQRMLRITPEVSPSPTLPGRR